MPIIPRHLFAASALSTALLSVPAQALLPTPLSVVNTGKLADTASEPTTKINAVDDMAINKTASDSTMTEQLMTWRTAAKAASLAEQTTWRRLLYFVDDKKGLRGKKAAASLVSDARFYLTANGQHDAAAELDALIVALAQEIAASKTADTKMAGSQPKPLRATDDAVLCRFPARVHWLSTMLNIDDPYLQAACPKLDDWMTMLAPKQLSVMFAQEYLDNPQSAFAHTLLRIDSQTGAVDPSNIQYAYALNDTVDGNPDDPFALYAIKSMTGGYDNIIEIDPYPKKLAQYIKDDERDVWTYQLALTPAEVQQIMRHVWETKALSLPYYFTTDNCASEILRLIDVVRPQQDLLSQLPYAVIPSDVIQLLAREQLLGEYYYTPSDSTVRQAQLNRAAVDKPSNHAVSNLTDNSASSLSVDGQRLLNLPISASDNNPLDRHPLQMASLGIGQRGDQRYADIGVRAGYHDLLDRPSGFAQFFNLEGAAATVRLYEADDERKGTESDRVVLQNATLIRGRSFNPVNTAKKGKSWGTSIEAKQVNDGSQQMGDAHLVGSASYETGWSWAFGTPRAYNNGEITGEMPPQLCYTFAAGTAQAGRGLNKGFRIGAGLHAGCDYQINNQLRVQAQLQLPYWYHGSSDETNVRGHYWQPLTMLGLQYDVDRKQALRIEASHDWQDRVAQDSDVQLSYRRYF